MDAYPTFFHDKTCSTPEGIGGGISRGAPRPRAIRLVLNARRHRRGNQQCQQLTRRCVLRQVLNARRHRRGNQRVAVLRAQVVLIGCSTPEGIGGGISVESSLRRFHLWLCSTPEGIGGGIRRAPTRTAARWRGVLNARRHRRGNQRRQRSRVGGRRPRVLNARRHRRGNQAEHIPIVCSTESVLNARRHRRGNQLDSRRKPGGPWLWCSTPEGIGGGISHAIAHKAGA